MKKILAMPQLIPQNQLNIDYVNEWRRLAARALTYRSSTRLARHPLRGITDVVYHYRKSQHSGVWFISLDGKSVDYLYAYTGIQLRQKHAAEALAYSFSPEVVGVTKEIFFGYLLPHSKFVVTDSMYTPDGHRWFLAQYSWALMTGAYRVYCLELSTSQLTEINMEGFKKLQPMYWGQEEVHQKYRFAIELS